MSTTDQFAIALQRMPHTRRMMLLDHVVDAGDETITCSAKPHGGPGYPLRVEGRLHAMALVELGAQAAAAHTSLFGVGKAHVGLLLTVSGVEVHCSDADALKGPLEVTACRLHVDDQGARYGFRVCERAASVVPALSGEAVLSMRAVE